MFTRRIVAGLFVLLPLAIVGSIVALWMPLPGTLDVQWSGADVSNTQPLWIFLGAVGSVAVLGAGMAAAAALARDRMDPHKGTIYLAALLTAGSAGLCIAIVAVNLGYAAPTGPAVLGALAIAPVYAILPLVVVSIGPRRASDQAASRFS